MIYGYFQSHGRVVWLHNAQNIYHVIFCRRSLLTTNAKKKKSQKNQLNKNEFEQKGSYFFWGEGVKGMKLSCIIHSLHASQKGNLSK